MKKFLFIILLFATSVYAGANFYGGAYLRIGLGPTGMALGNAGVARPNSNPASVYYNPAVISTLQTRAVEFGYNLMSLDREFLYIAFATKLKGTAALGASYIRSGVGNVESRDYNGNPYGEIENSFHTGQVVFGKSFGAFSFGFALRLMYEFMDNPEFSYTGSGVSMDIGLLYIFNEHLSIGAAVKDINGKLESNSDKIYDQGQNLANKFPVIYKVGIAWTVKKEWGSIYYDFEESSAKRIKHHLGIESAAIRDVLVLRAGMENNRFTAGVGFAFKTFGYNSQINYVYLPSVIDEGDSHAFSWIFSF